MKNPVEPKVVIITGASSGIGAETARLLAKRGHRLVLAARRTERLAALAAECEQAGGEVLALTADVCQANDIQCLVDQPLARWGRIDVLVNNAGCHVISRLTEVTPESVEQIIATDLTAVIKSTRAVLPAMLQQKSGHIVNVSSAAGAIGLPTWTVYSAAKFGVAGFSEALLRELKGSGVKVSTIFPGYTVTELFPQTQKMLLGQEQKVYIRDLMTVEYVAKHLARLVEHPRRKVILPHYWRLLFWGNALMPWFADWMVPLYMIKEG